MLDFRSDRDERIKWWNVVVLMNDGSYRAIQARGEDLDGAKRWLERATYLLEPGEYRAIVEFSEDCSSNYDEFLRKEKELKNKYKII